MNTKTIAIILLVLIVALVGGAVLILNKDSMNNKKTSNSQSPEAPSTKVSDALLNKVSNTSIIISETGITTAALNIKNNGTLTFVNSTGKSVDMVITDKNDKEIATVTVSANSKSDTPKFTENKIYKYFVKGNPTVGFINVTD